jgi:hypothetical protein
MLGCGRKPLMRQLGLGTQPIKTPKPADHRQILIGPVTVITFLNKRVRRRPDANVLALDVYYKSISHFYFLKLYFQYHI